MERLRIPSRVRSHFHPEPQPFGSKLYDASLREETVRRHESLK